MCVRHKYEKNRESSYCKQGSNHYSGESHGAVSYGLSIHREGLGSTFQASSKGSTRDDHIRFAGSPCSPTEICAYDMKFEFLIGQQEDRQQIARLSDSFGRTTHCSMSDVTDFWSQEAPPYSERPPPDKNEVSTAQIEDGSAAMSAEFSCIVRQMLQSLMYDEPVYAARLTFGQLRQEHLKSGSSGITM